jgi:hypothetical protein
MVQRVQRVAHDPEKVVYATRQLLDSFPNGLVVAPGVSHHAEEVRFDHLKVLVHDFPPGPSLRLRRG